jgi:hypothetical protein
MRLIRRVPKRLMTILLLGALLAVSVLASYGQVELATTRAQLNSARQGLSSSQEALANAESRATAFQQELARVQQAPRIPTTLPATSETVMLRTKLDDIDSLVFRICLRVGC